MCCELRVNKQEGQVALNCSPEFCLKLLIFWYLLETGHVPCAMYARSKGSGETTLMGRLD